jgi:multidrug efflux pump subunit AcrA (membrane-fusion protein)
MHLKSLIAAAALGGAAILAPVAATPASAFTPGHVCTIEVSFGPEFIDFPGTIAADGNTCVPNTPIGGPLQSLDAGVACGFRGDVAGFFVGSFCYT